MVLNEVIRTQQPELDSQKKKQMEAWLDDTRQAIVWVTEKEITLEEFQNLSFEEIEKNLKVVDWKLFLFWKSMDYWFNNVYWSKDKRTKIMNLLSNDEFKENLEYQIKQKELLIDILEIWTVEATTQYQKAWFKSYRWIDYEKNINLIFKMITDFWVPVSQELFKKQCDNIFNLIFDSENQKEIIWRLDMIDVKEIFFSKDKSFENKQIKIFNYMRYWWYSWNTEWVKSIISNKLLQKEEFKDINNIINNPEIWELIQNENYKWLESKVWKETTQKIRYIYRKSKEQIKEKLEQQIEFENKENKKIWKQEISYNEYLKQNEWKIKEIEISSTLETLKYYLLDKKIDSLWNRWSEKDSLTWIYANTIWLWETFIWDYFTIADSNIDLAIDMATSLAIWAISMWVWIAAASWLRASLWAMRAIPMLWNWVKAVQVSKYIWNWTKAWRVLWFVWDWVIEWTWFYWWTNTLHNAMFWEINEISDLFKWNMDSQWLSKSILFMLSLNTIWIFSQVSWLWKFTKFEDLVPKWYLKSESISKIVNWSLDTLWKWFATWTSMYSISLVIDKLYWENWNPTWREYIEFILLIQLMHLKDIWKKQKNLTNK